MTLVMEDTSPPDATDPAGGGTCVSGTCAGPTVTFPVTSAWTQIPIPWSEFTAGSANGASVPATGDNITGFNFSVNLAYVDDGTGTWVPDPAAIEIVVDDITFFSSNPCTGGTTLCGASCVDLNTDAANCGVCGTACTGPYSCESGICTCPAGYEDCGDVCADLDIDVDNCGSCGNPCNGVCSGGACQASSCTSGMPQQNYSCTEYNQIVLGKYWVNNNVWGADGATGSQCIWSTCQSGNTIGWGTDWTWSGAASSVKSYASAVLGWHWGWVVPQASTGLPIQLSSGASATCGWTFQVTQSGTINVAYDLWLHSISNPDYASDPTEEIMIWLYNSGAGPIGTQQTTVTIGGASWALYRGQNGSTNVYSFLRSSNTTSTTLNLMDFLSDLVSRGWVSSSRYLTSIEAGTEVFTGTGSVDTDSYSCVIQ
jgi:hypothetical protein